MANTTKRKLQLITIIVMDWKVTETPDGNHLRTCSNYWITIIGSSSWKRCSSIVPYRRIRPCTLSNGTTMVVYSTPTWVEVMSSQCFIHSHPTWGESELKSRLNSTGFSGTDQITFTFPLLPPETLYIHFLLYWPSRSARPISFSRPKYPIWKHKILYSFSWQAIWSSNAWNGAWKRIYPLEKRIIIERETCKCFVQSNGDRIACNSSILQRGPKQKTIGQTMENVE